MAYNLNN